MKVYELHYDNGEPWEDGYDCTEKIFATYEAAKKYLVEECFEIKEYEDGKRYDWCEYVTLASCNRKKYVCKNGNTDCDNCKKYLDWVDADYEPEDFCDEYDKMWDDYHSNEWWEVREWEVIE